MSLNPKKQYTIGSWFRQYINCFGWWCFFIEFTARLSSTQGLKRPALRIYLWANIGTPSKNVKIISPVLSFNRYFGWFISLCFILMECWLRPSSYRRALDLPKPERTLNRVQVLEESSSSGPPSPSPREINWFKVVNKYLNETVYIAFNVCDCYYKKS